MNALKFKSQGSLLKNKGILSVLVLGTFIITLIALASVRSNRTIVALADNDREAGRNIITLDTTLSALKDIETGPRGYLITKDVVYLEPYYDAQIVLEEQLVIAKRSFLSDIKQDNRLTILNNLIAERIKTVENTIRLVRANKIAEATEIIKSNRGKSLMDRIRFLVDEMKEEELRKQVRYENLTKIAANNLLLSIVVLAILEVIVVATSLILIDREILKRIELIKTIEARAIDLESTYTESEMNQLAADKVLRDVVKTLRGVK